MVDAQMNDGQETTVDSKTALTPEQELQQTQLAEFNAYLRQARELYQEHPTKVSHTENIYTLIALLT